MTFVLKLEPSVSARSGPLQWAGSRESLHARLLVHAQHGLSVWSPHIESNDRPHLLLELRIITVAPSTNSMRFDLGVVKDPTDLTGTDLTHQTLRDQSLPQRNMTPHGSAKSKLVRGLAGRCDDLMSLKRRDLDRTPAAIQVRQALDASFSETPKPLPHAKSICSELPRNRRDRLAFRREKDHTSPPIATGFTPLLSDDLLEIFPNLPRKANAHGSAEECTRTLGALH